MERGINTNTLQDFFDNVQVEILHLRNVSSIKKLK